MDLNYSPEEEEFRGKVRGWLEENLPQSGLRGEARTHGEKSTLQKMREWHGRLYEAGYLALSWPKEYGGQVLDPVRQAIVNEEMVRARAPGAVGAGIPLLGPTLITWGTGEQKARYLPKVLSGEEIWCQGYSEPGRDPT
jgi:alkylation response protein AidB-like acyl-CoA dehydrogenase